MLEPTTPKNYDCTITNPMDAREIILHLDNLSEAKGAIKALAVALPRYNIINQSGDTGLDEFMESLSHHLKNRG